MLRRLGSLCCSGSVDEVNFPAPLGDRDDSLPRFGLDGHEQVGGAVAHILVVLLGGVVRCHGQRLAAVADELLTGAYAKARRIHLVLDNLNTHFRKCFDDVLGKRAAAKLLRRVQFHYTPKHASWLNMAEIEIGILSRQCLDRRIVSRELLQSEVDAWQQARNEEKRTIEWNFTRQDADLKLGQHYVSKLAC